MCRLDKIGKVVSFTILSFGAGVLLTFLLPMRLLVAIEAILLIAAGIVLFLSLR